MLQFQGKTKLSPSIFSRDWNNLKRSPLLPPQMLHLQLLQ